MYNQDAMKNALMVHRDDGLPVKRDQMNIDQLAMDGGGGYALDIFHRDRSIDCQCTLYPEGSKKEAEDDMEEIAMFMDDMDYREIDFEQFREWLLEAYAIVVDGQYVIYPPNHIEDGEIEFRECEGQEDAYFIINNEWTFTMCPDTSVRAVNPAFDETTDIMRLIPEFEVRELMSKKS